MIEANIIMSKDMSIEVQYLDRYKVLQKEKCSIKNCKTDGMFFLPQEKIVLCYEHFLELKKKFAEKK